MVNILRDPIRLEATPGFTDEGMEGEEKRKRLAWLFGYAAHVTMDVTIHPIVELKVGPYAENKRAHRVCEMHQDEQMARKAEALIKQLL